MARRDEDLAEAVNLIVTIAGNFDLTDDDLSGLQEDMEDECRAYWGGSGVSVEVVKA